MTDLNYKLLSIMTISLLSLGLVGNSHAQQVEPGHEIVQMRFSQFQFIGTSPLPFQISGNILPVNSSKTISIVIMDSQQNTVASYNEYPASDGSFSWNTTVGGSSWSAGKYTVQVTYGTGVSTDTIDYNVPVTLSPIGGSSVIPITTGKSTYQRGEIVAIFGNNAGSTATVTIKIFDNLGTIIDTLTTTSANSGLYNANWQIPNNTNLGQYVIQVQSPAGAGQTNIIIVGTPTSPPQNQIVVATNLQGAVVNYPTPTIIDNVVVTNPTCTPPSGSTFPIGDNTVTCTATDAAGNIRKATFSVYVRTSPYFTPTITTDKQTYYSAGSTVFISGTNFPPNANLILTILNPNTNINSNVLPITITNQGQFSTTWTIPSTFDPGAYVIQLSSMPSISTKIQVYTNTIPSPPPSGPTNPNAITVTTDKSTYNDGDVITISGSTALECIISDTPIWITITDPLGNTVIESGVKLGNDKTFTTSVTPSGPRWQDAGTYQVLVRYCGNDNTVKTHFQFTGFANGHHVTATIWLQGGYPNPHAIAVNPITNKIYVSSGNSISVIDGTTNNVTNIIPSHIYDQPSAIAVNPTNNKIYVANSLRLENDPERSASHWSDITVIDGITDRITARIPLEWSDPHQIAVNPTTNKIYVPDLNGVTVIDGATNNATTIFFSYQSETTHIAVNPTTNKIYADHIGDLWVIDGFTNVIADKITISTDSRISNVAVNPITNKVYVNSGSSSNWDEPHLAVIDGSTNKITATTIPIHNDLLVNPTTNMIYSTGLGKDNIPPNNGTISVIDGSTNTISSTIGGIEPGPFGMAVNPITNTIYISNYDQGHVTVIDGNLKGDNSIQPLSPPQTSQQAQTNPNNVQTTPNPVITNATLQYFGQIASAKYNHIIAAEVNVGDNQSTTTIDNSVSVQTTSNTPDSLNVNVSAPSETGPKVIMFNLNATTINVANLKDLGVMYDGKLIQPAPNMDAILHAKPTDNPSFAIVVTQSGVQVLVLVPHFSTHSITITNMSKVITPAIPEFPFASIVLIIAILSIVLIQKMKLTGKFYT
ncbi:MAG: HYR domain-containing protein [Nitrosopumilaceae archaeon]|nr:MAG: HYR domain-containing protein [Nitrosopumilaceae archaeon]